MRIKIMLILLAAATFSFSQVIKNRRYEKPRLKVERSDIYIEKVDGNSYDIYVQKKGDIESVMLIYGETIDDEYYSLRALEYNSINGNEKRILNGKVLEQNNNFSIIDSTPTMHDKLGEAFRLRLTGKVLVGSRFHGNERVATIKEGDPINIRTFSQKYCDHDSGVYQDNRIELLPDEEEEYDPRLTLDKVENEGDYYALYVRFSGGDKRPRTFYHREQQKEGNYKKLPVMWSLGKEDGAAIVLNDYFDEKSGKQMRIKAFYKASTNERDIYINVFDNEGDTETPPVHFKIPAKEKDPPKPKPEPEKNEKYAVRKDVLDDFSKIAKAGDGKSLAASEPEDLPKKIEKVIDDVSDENAEIDFIMVIDNTGSMREDVAEMKKEALNFTGKLSKQNKKVRYAMVLYRDYTSSFLTKKYDFTESAHAFGNNIKSIPLPKGGGDDPEAVHEGLKDALRSLNYKSPKRIVLLIGDAPPRPDNRIDLKQLMEYEKVKNPGLELKIYTITVADDREKVEKMGESVD